MNSILSAVKHKILLRVILGYVASLFIIVGIVLFTSSGLKKISITVDDITNRLTQTRTLSHDIDNKLQLVRYYADRYQRFYSQSDLDLYHQKLHLLNDSQKQLSLLVQAPKIQQQVKDIRKEINYYSNDFTQITKLIMYQQSLLSTILLKKEILIENQLSAIRINVGIVQVPEIYFSFGNARSSFELMRLYESKYISGNDEKYYVMFKNHYKIAAKSFEQLIKALYKASKDEKIINNAQIAKSELDVYYTTFLDIHDANIKLKKLRVSLQSHEVKVVGAVANIAQSIEAEYVSNNHLTQELVEDILVQLILAVIVAIVVGLGLIGVILKKVIAPTFLELQQLSNLDALTQIANRRAFDVKINNVMNNAKHKETPVSLILCDVDLFKKYNDHYGHQMGDSCLQELANLLNEESNPLDYFVARYGGEEFILLLTDTTSEEAQLFATRLKEKVEALHITHEYSSASSYVTMSMGVASTEDMGSYDVEELIRRSDQALYCAKQNKRNTVVLFSPQLKCTF